MVKEVVGYVRVSTVKQKLDGVSIEMQKELLSKHAVMMGLVKKTDEIIFFVDDGFSGKSLQRPQMQKMIEKIEKNEISILLCYDLSRLSRDLFDCNRLLKLMKEHDVIVHCLYDRADINTAGDRFTTNIKILNNQYERERIVERTNDGLTAIVESGRYPCGGPVPFGYQRGDDKNIYIHPLDGKIIKTIFSMAAKGYSIREIELKVNTMKNSKGSYINATRIKRYIKSRKYTGYFVYKGKVYTNIIPQLVDEKTFKLAQRCIKKHTKTRKHYIFDNKVICEKCGSVLKNTHGQSKGIRYYYYKCEICKKSISEKKIHYAMLGNDLENSGNTRDDILKAIDDRINKVNNKIQKVKENYIDELLSDEQYLYLIVPLDEKIKQLQKEKYQLKKNIDNSVTYKDLATAEDKYNYVSVYIDRITVDPDKKRVIDIKMKK